MHKVVRTIIEIINKVIILVTNCKALRMNNLELDIVNNKVLIK